MKRKQWIIIGVGILLLVAAFGIGRLAGGNNASTATDQSPSEEYPLLAKRLFIDNPSDTRINFSPLRTALNQYFSENLVQGSLYFEYLPTGTSIRINADDRYRAASLMKLPVAMELYKTSEQGKVNLDETIQLKEEWLNDEFGTLYKKGAGHELTRREAAKIMLTESDNTALRAILEVTETSLENNDRALGYLDIDFQNLNDEISIGARSYSSFLKCLYFACYNTKENSQEMLRYLSESSNSDRLRAGIDDKDVVIAHKIGVFNTQVQSDCGIVYVEKNNYLICIMLNGANNDTTNHHISELSKIVYTYIKDPIR